METKITYYPELNKNIYQETVNNIINYCKILKTSNKDSEFKLNEFTTLIKKSAKATINSLDLHDKIYINGINIINIYFDYLEIKIPHPINNYISFHVNNIDSKFDIYNYRYNNDYYIIEGEELHNIFQQKIQTNMLDIKFIIGGNIVFDFNIQLVNYYIKECIKKHIPGAKCGIFFPIIDICSSVEQNIFYSYYNKIFYKFPSSTSDEDIFTCLRKKTVRKGISYLNLKIHKKNKNTIIYKPIIFIPKTKKSQDYMISDKQLAFYKYLKLNDNHKDFSSISHYCYYEYHWTIYTTFINALVDNITNTTGIIKIHAIENSNIRIPIYTNNIKNPRISYSSIIMITNGELLHPYYKDIRIKLKNEDLLIGNVDTTTTTKENNNEEDNISNSCLLSNLCVYCSVNSKQIENNKLEIGVVHKMSGIVLELSTF